MPPARCNFPAKSGSPQRRGNAQGERYYLCCGVRDVAEPHVLLSVLVELHDVFSITSPGFLPKSYSASHGLFMHLPAPACSRKSILFCFQKLPPSFGVYFLTTEGNQSFATLKLPFWDIDFKDIDIKKQKTQNEILSFPTPFPAQEIHMEGSTPGRTS